MTPREAIIRANPTSHPKLAWTNLSQKDAATLSSSVGGYGPSTPPTHEEKFIRTEVGNVIYKIPVRNNGKQYRYLSRLLRENPRSREIRLRL